MAQNKYLSDSAVTLISKLLVKSPSDRLGSRPHDVAAIRKAKFFEGIDWTKVRNRSVNSNLDLILDQEERERDQKCNVTQEEGGELEGETEEMEHQELESLEGDCSRTSLWLDGFTQGPLTQMAT